MKKIRKKKKEFAIAEVFGVLLLISLLIVIVVPRFAAFFRILHSIFLG